MVIFLAPGGLLVKPMAIDFHRPRPGRVSSSNQGPAVASRGIFDVPVEVIVLAPGRATSSNQGPVVASRGIFDVPVEVVEPFLCVFIAVCSSKVLSD
jgi:hypothetical protein